MPAQKKKPLRYYKLLNGEDIVAIVDAEDKDNVYLSNPVAITSFRVDGSEELVFTLAPWTFSANSEQTTINKAHYLASFDVKLYLSEQYGRFLKAEQNKSNFLEQRREERHAALEAFIRKQGETKTICHN